MAPERFQSGDIEPSSDIYALACVFYQCLTGEPPFPGNTLEQVAVGHMVAPPPRASEAKDTVPTELDRVIETGLAKQTSERYSTAVEMAAAARRAITEPTSQPHSGPTQLAPISDGSPRWPPPPDPVQTYPTPPPHGPPPQYGQPPPYGPPQWAPQQWGPPPPTPPPIAKRPGRRRGVLIGAVVFIVTLIVVAGAVFTVVGLNRSNDSPAKPSTPAGGGLVFSGTYRADYGPGTDLDGKPVPNAPATTSSWDVRSECGARGCVATAASASGNSLLSNMTFDQLGGTWVAVGLASAECGGATPSEVWVVVTLQPQSDDTLTGDTVRSSTDSLCAAKRTVKFTRTGDPDLGKVPDPAVLPPRVVSPADGLRGSYRQTTTFTNGQVIPGKVLAANTYCLRTGDRCMSLFHAGGGAVTLMYADDKWTRNEQGTTTCGAGGTAQITITAEYPMPRQLDDPIAVLTGRGSQTVAAGGACTGGGDFEDQFQRTGD
jgi:serine/threonine-protein kinase